MSPDLYENISLFDANGNHVNQWRDQCHSSVDDISCYLKDKGIEEGYLFHYTRGDGDDPYDKPDFTWCSKKDREMFLEFLVFNSPFTKYITPGQTLDFIEKCGVILPVTTPGRVFAAFGMQLRQLWENQKRFQSFKRFQKSGFFSDWESLMLSNILVGKTFSSNFEI